MIEFLVNQIINGTVILGKPFTYSDAIAIINRDVPEDRRDSTIDELNNVLLLRGHVDLIKK